MAPGGLLIGSGQQDFPAQAAAYGDPVPDAMWMGAFANKRLS
jgi:hypothetical protein